ncbi:hypothetical protein EBZ37_03785, partial [bacterium]|nr:hypothetical protein [bacterium]
MSENNSSSDKKSQESSSDYGIIEEMPTVTTLLDRRKLRANTPAPAPSPVPGTEPEEPGAISPKIKVAPRSTERRRALRLELWTPEVLAQSTV